MAAQTLSSNQTVPATAAPTVAPAATAATGANAPNANQYAMCSLYVGDLHPSVTESLLYQKFSEAGSVLSIRVCRDAITRRSLGYAYVNFQQPADAERALDTMNFDIIEDRPMRIMWSQRDPTIRRSGAGNVFIKNLDPNIDTKSIYDTFSMFGNILSCKIATDEEGHSKGYGFIHFETEEAAQKAIEKINGMLLDGKQVYVGKFQPRASRLREMGEPAHRFTNVFVKNFSDKYDEAKIRSLFEAFGPITSCAVMTDDAGKSKGFGFVAFENPEDAEKAVESLNESPIPDSDLKLTVCRAQKKAEREAELSRVYEQLKAERMQRYAGVNLYVKNLDEKVDNEELKRTFQQYGPITSAKVMTDENGRSKGFGFVCFEKPDDATVAIGQVYENKTMLHNKLIYVALAQRKEERKAQLASQYMQRMANMRMQNVPMYQPNAAFYVQPGLNSRPYVNALQNQMRSMPRGWTGAMGSSGYNTMPTLVQQSQFRGAPRQGNNLGRQTYAGRAGGQQNRPLGNQQMRPQLGQNKVGGQYYQQGQQVRAQQPHVQGGPNATVQRDELTTKLASASPQEQKQILGEQLYPLISSLCSEDMVGKITGMVLEMENTELLMCLENQELLQEHVNEAIITLNAKFQSA